jgi:hypothetical protein
MADIIPKKFLTPQNILLGAGLAVALYFGYQYLHGDDSKKKKAASNHQMSFAEDQTVRADPHLDLRVSPSVAVPGISTTVMISGVFKNDDGNPSPVPVGYYAIYDSSNRMVTQGTLGTNVTSFSKSVVIPPLRNGEFMVSVSDEPIALAPGVGGGNYMSYPQGPYGYRRHHHHGHHRGLGQQQQQMLPQTPQQLNISLQSPIGSSTADPTQQAPAPTAAVPPMNQQQQIYPPTTGATDTSGLQPLTPGVI